MWRRLRAPRPPAAAGGYRRAQSVPCRYVKSSSIGDDDDLELQLSTNPYVETVPFTIPDECANTETLHRQQNEPLLLESSSTSTMYGGVGSVAAAGRLTPRYRFRDLLMGDFAFNDDGER